MTISSFKMTGTNNQQQLKEKCWILPSNNVRQLRFDPQNEQKMVPTFIDLYMLFLWTPKNPQKSSPVYLKDLLPGIAIFHHLPIHGATALVLVATAEDDVSEQGLVVHSACQRSARFLGHIMVNAWYNCISLCKYN